MPSRSMQSTLMNLQYCMDTHKKILKQTLDLLTMTDRLVLAND